MTVLGEASSEMFASGRYDAYFLWGLATGFASVYTEPPPPPAFGPPSVPPPGSSTGRPDPSRLVGLLIEWNSLQDAAAAAPAVLAAGARTAGVYQGDPGQGGQPVRRTWAVTVAIKDLERLLGGIRPWMARMELAAPIRPASGLPAGDAPGPRSLGDVLLASIDDGCAFAHARFRDGRDTRVLWLWNQDPEAEGARLHAVAGPSPLASFGYGRQLSQQALGTLIREQVTEEAIYEAAGLKGLRRSAVHGTHGLDLLARDPDAWPIVFVQLPNSALDDPSGRWLGRHMLDGLHYILLCAGPSTSRVVVNISWGPQTGPHDGTSILETAIDELVESQRQAGRELIVCLAAGNTYGAQAHASFDGATGGHVDWIVPPDGSTPAFLEVWWPSSVSASDASLTLTSPSGQTWTVGGPVDTTVAGCVVVSMQPVGQGPMALIALHPTGGDGDAPPGQHGRWHLEVGSRSDPGHGEIHLYVARADHGMGARRRAKASYLTDAALEATRFVTPAHRHDEAAGSAIRRAGTLSGLATGRQTQVAAGYVHATRASAPYSSSGPTRGRRIGPDHACVTDLSQAVPGVRAAGVRSGTTVRLVGTSSAAPQLGRRFSAMDVGQLSAPRPSVDPHRVGSSYLPPDGEVVRHGRVEPLRDLPPPA